MSVSGIHCQLILAGILYLLFYTLVFVHCLLTGEELAQILRKGWSWSSQILDRRTQMTSVHSTERNYVDMSTRSRSRREGHK